MPAYDLRIFKSWKARNMKAAWVNTYVLNYDQDDIESPNVVAAVNAFVAMEQQFHLTDVQFLHATFSTKRDEPVYDPRTLRVVELNVQGGGNMTVENPAVDLNICLKMKKQVAFGRSGTMFYRGALTAADVMNNSRGEAELRPDSKYNTPGNISNAYANVMNFAPMQWIMADKRVDRAAVLEVIPFRTVMGIAASGCSLNKRDHKYFDEIPKELRAALRALRATGGTLDVPPPALPPAP